MRFLKTLPFAALFVAALALCSHAQPGPGKGPNSEKSMKMDHRAMLKEEIGLSDDQLKKLEAIKIETEKTAEKCKYDIKTEMLTVQEMAIKGTLTKVKIKESLGKTSDAKAKMQAARQQGLLKAVDVFTDDQIKIMADKKLLNRIFDNDHEQGMGKGRMGRGGRDECPLMKKGAECPKKKGQ